MGGKALKPGRHRPDWYEGGGGEHKRGEHRERRGLGALGIADGQPDGRENPGHGETEEQDQSASADEGDDAVVNTEPDGHADTDDEGEHEDVAYQVGDGSAG